MMNDWCNPCRIRHPLLAILSRAIRRILRMPIACKATKKMSYVTKLHAWKTVHQLGGSFFLPFFFFSIYHPSPRQGMLQGGDVWPKISVKLLLIRWLIADKYESQRTDEATAMLAKSNWAPENTWKLCDKWNDYSDQHAMNRQMREEIILGGFCANAINYWRVLSEGPQHSFCKCIWNHHHVSYVDSKQNEPSKAVSLKLGCTWYHLKRQGRCHQGAGMVHCRTTLQWTHWEGALLNLTLPKFNWGYQCCSK